MYLSRRSFFFRTSRVDVFVMVAGGDRNERVDSRERQGLWRARRNDASVAHRFRETACAFL